MAAASPATSSCSTFPEGAGSLAEMITWSVDHGPRVINMSILERDASGVPLAAPNQATEAAIRNAKRRALLVAAAGNCGEGNARRGYRSPIGLEQCHGKDAVLYPAGYVGVLGVGAYSSGSLRGGRLLVAQLAVDVAAPGDLVSSTLFDKNPGNPAGSAIATIRGLGGTSQAAPMVSGAAAVLFAHRPDLRPEQVEAALESTARPAGGPWSDAFGHGRIDPVAAAQRLDADLPATPLSLAALRNAAVPSMCGHPAGTLTNGSRPEIPAAEGGVWLNEQVPIATEISRTTASSRRRWSWTATRGVSPGLSRSSSTPELACSSAPSTSGR